MIVGGLFRDDWQMMEFHISKGARDRYQFAENLFSFAGNVVFANLAASRTFAHRMNQVRDSKKHPERAVHAGALYVMGLLDEASHVVMARYREQLDPAVMTDALSWIANEIGAAERDKMLLSFVEQFPGTTVYQGLVPPAKWLAGSTDGVPHRAVALEEMMLLWMANRNQAFQPFEELFRDKSLAEKTAYQRIAEKLPEYFRTRPLIEVEDGPPLNLFELLRVPALAAPGSLSEQLAVVRSKWKSLLGASLERLLSIAGGILHEEELAIWLQFHPPSAESAAEAEARARAAEAAQRRRGQGPSPGHSEVPVFGDPANEYEKFSADRDWMPNTVLIAKSTYVWLAQLSKEYGREIARLDQIPNEELETLARRGLNSLWLIGIWERSRASQTIKQLCGNSDAVASAYSLFDYRIADDLGGESAYINLRDRCYARGIRLASDMVPNHMGIDSPWVVEHPEWFISRPDAPYPAYSFDGPNLSHDSRVEIRIEKHYFDQSDAAVVFERRDRRSGETRYIYHGNDGTSFPWNDTAQLDYLNPAVREQVIQTILHVARLFPVIRFDAAMTLAKRHFHRLWFPGPGASGAIPSRAEYGMSDAEFNRLMPEEFWREVVDRVAVEVPGTLLLAEAFWLMEGYFVRTLGMHRVYNSAFMNMMRDEQNAKYRSVLKNTLEFDPDIMKRYVNFMSNPDERTAIDQFGTGDKCFGVAAMMATLPGLPMFGHGQVEGYTEKYGMEYRRPRYDESPDHWLVERHQREIAPLLRDRSLFAESSNFLLYDCFQEDGTVDENVFAYSNRRAGQRGLVLYNNRYATARGTIHSSAAYADKQSGQLRQQRLREGLDLTGDPSIILAYRDSLTGLEYLGRASKIAEQGLRIELHAYQCHIFLDWRELRASADKHWDRLCDQLNGSGVPNLEDALVDLELRPTHDALRRLLDRALVTSLVELAEHPGVAAGLERSQNIQRTAFFELEWERTQSFLREAQIAYRARSGRALPNKLVDPGSLAEKFRSSALAAMHLPALESRFPKPWTAAARRVLPSQSPLLAATAIWGPVLACCVLDLLARWIDAENPERTAIDLFDRLRLRQPLGEAFAALGFEGEECWRAAARVKVALLAAAGEEAAHASAIHTEDSAVHTAADTGQDSRAGASASPRTATEADAKADVSKPILPEALWQDPDVRWLIGVHEAQGHSYFVRESYEDLLWWLQLPALCGLASQPAPDPATTAGISAAIRDALEAASKADYRIDALLQTPDSHTPDSHTVPAEEVLFAKGPEPRK